MEQWNSGDKETFNRHGEVPFDGSFVFAARQKLINELRKEVEKITKK